MARQDMGGRPSRVLSWPVPPPLDLLHDALPAAGSRGGLHDVAVGLWQAARETAGQVDREVTVRLLFGACHLLGRPAADGEPEEGLLPAALHAADRARKVLREQRTVDVDELLRVAWALAELESLPSAAAVAPERARAGLGGQW